MSASRKAVESIKFTDRHKVHIKSRNSKTCESLKREIQAVEDGGNKACPLPPLRREVSHPSSFLSDLLFSNTNCSLATLFLCVVSLFVCVATGILLRRRSCFPYLVITQPHWNPRCMATCKGGSLCLPLCIKAHPPPPASKHHWHTRPRIVDHTFPANSAKTRN